MLTTARCVTKLSASYLIAAIASGIMAHVATRSTKRRNFCGDGGIAYCRLKGMAGMMTVLSLEARHTKVVVGAVFAGDEHVFRKDYH